MCFKVLRCGGLPDLPERRGWLCAVLAAGTGHAAAGGDDEAKQHFFFSPSRGNRRHPAGCSTLPHAGFTDEILPVISGQSASFSDLIM